MQASLQLLSSLFHSPNILPRTFRHIFLDRVAQMLYCWAEEENRLEFHSSRFWHYMGWRGGEEWALSIKLFAGVLDKDNTTQLSLAQKWASLKQLFFWFPLPGRLLYASLLIWAFPGWNSNKQPPFFLDAKAAAGFSFPWKVFPPFLIPLSPLPTL